ncbi:protein translocase subunit SecD [Spirochaetia bacterium]|nr:protein translocase subunit SecD [Spirochaetia bacterium]
MAVLAVCFAFLWPTLRWYFFVPLDRQAQALQTRDQIRDYSSQTAQTDLNEIKQAAATGEALPVRFSYLVPDAKTRYKGLGWDFPTPYTARDVLEGYSSETAAREVIESYYRDDLFALKDLQKSAIQLGLDLSGGLSIVLQADMDAYAQKLNRTATDADRTTAMDTALQVLNSRIDRFGLTEPVIRRQGNDQIYVEIPGAADPERINGIIMGNGSLTFHIVDSEAAAAFNSYYTTHPDTIPDERGKLSVPVPGVSQDVCIYGVYDKDSYGLDIRRGYTAVKEEVGLDGNHIRDAMVSRNNLDGKPEVTFMLDDEGAEIFYKLTSANIGKPLAIVLDGRVKSQATIQSAIREAVRLTGFGLDEANNIALTLKTAALPVELAVVNQQSVGPSMGADTIQQGLYALLGGIVVVLIFMLAFYKASGINAVVAQLFNIYIMLSVLSAFNFTLTLPSIAAFILTIGMAVDANVIIFERMKEEMRLGKTRKAVIDAGFNKAFWAIMDSNITTFIAALFLSQLGTGPIQGFAVSLAIGVFSSVFTALFVSRLMFDFSTDVLHSKRVSVSWRIK